MNKLIPFVQPSGPPPLVLPVTNIALLLNPANVTLNAGKIVQFNDAPITNQTDATKRATQIAAHSGFKNKPAALFLPSLDNLNWHVYPLGNLSALTEAEIFAVLHMRYGQSTEAHPNGDHTGLWHLSASGLATHYKFTDDQIWDGTGTNNRWTYNDTVGDYMTDIPHILNIRVKAGEWVMSYLDNVSYPNPVVIQTQTSFSVAFPNNAQIGRHGSYGVFMAGWLGHFTLCSQVQTAPARLAMMTYLRDTYLP